MKKGIRLLSIVTIFCMLLGMTQTAYAENITMEIVYDASENKLNVSGISGNLPNKVVNIAVIAGMKTTEELDNSQAADLRFTTTKEGGVYN